jgi:peroxiredoxin
MVMTASTMLPLGTEAPDFALPDAKGNLVSLSDFEGTRALVVVFMCNHCPFVKHVINSLAKLAKEYQSRGVAFVGINANDVSEFPEDRPEKMAEFAREKGFTFPYLYDETQDVAKRYRAACTPDFFVFDEKRRLVYRGQMDDSRPGSNVPVTGADLRAALDAAREGEAVPGEQKPSMGCNIKWRSGNEPDYF